MWPPFSTSSVLNRAAKSLSRSLHAQQGLRYARILGNFGQQPHRLDRSAVCLPRTASHMLQWPEWDPAGVGLAVPLRKVTASAPGLSFSVSGLHNQFGYALQLGLQGVRHQDLFNLSDVISSTQIPRSVQARQLRSCCSEQPPCNRLVPCAIAPAQMLMPAPVSLPGSSPLTPGIARVVSWFRFVSSHLKMEAAGGPPVQRYVVTSPESSRRKGALWHCSGLLRVSFTLSRVITTFWTRLSLTPVSRIF